MERSTRGFRSIMGKDQRRQGGSELNELLVEISASVSARMAFESWSLPYLKIFWMPAFWTVKR
jgi:hypothetical protein